MKKTQTFGTQWKSISDTIMNDQTSDQDSQTRSNSVAKASNRIPEEEQPSTSNSGDHQSPESDQPTQKQEDKQILPKMIELSTYTPD